MPRQIHVGLITQAGGAHVDLYLQSLAQADEVATVSIADPSGRAFDLAHRLLGKKMGETYASAADLLAREDSALALITVEGASAPPVITAALDAGCHVLTEKPACVRAEDFARLVQHADTKHKLLMLALANRTNAVMQEARRLIRTGTLGKVYGCEIHIVADQTRLTAPEYRKTWFADPARAGGGHLLWLGIHWLDLAMYLTGSRVQEIAGFRTVVGGTPLQVEDSAVAALKFENGSLGTIHSGYYLDKGYHTHLKIWGALGWLQMDRETDELHWSSRQTEEGKLQIFSGKNKPAGYPPFVQAAVRAAAGLSEPPITAAEGLAALQTVFSLYKGAETGRTQRVG
jgi:predicted dehydrogenase